MADAREPYLVQVNNIGVVNDYGKPVITKAWLNIYYIAYVKEVKDEACPMLYKAGARWVATLVDGNAFFIDDEDCEKIIININGSY